MSTSIEPILFHDIEAWRLTVNDATAVVSRYGAQVLSWVSADGIERLFLSDKARYDGSASIRGGVPVCFPQFSNLGDLPKHGLVRQRLWNLSEQSTRDGFAVLCLAIEDDEETRALWPYAFRAELTVALEANRLDVELAVENKGSEAMEFTAALHSYLRVGEVENARVQGLAGLEYRDAAKGNAIRQELEHELVVEDEVDRVYHNVKRPLLLSEGGRNLGIYAEDFPDVVVWNPWEHLCAKFVDMEPKDFRRMLCIEAAAARRPVRLAAGETWFGRQALVVA
ncbi:MAG TPA: D-hexose-6-phosphate mutarotase [Rhodocyclaceae bacterium]|nr:D-hexose-6-phosphate mutarotase [Rhodocyclaceae bacterium]